MSLLTLAAVLLAVAAVLGLGFALGMVGEMFRPNGEWVSDEVPARSTAGGVWPRPAHGQRTGTAA